jgi:DNA polymerase-3 subunit gamma/tau
VVSFGSGPVTAERVREVLGLIPDDVYGELLRVVAERAAAGVFPLVERIVNGGADLGEFVTGAGEVLRAVLLANLGGKPAGFTEAMQHLIERYRSALPAPDVVRLLAVLTELEPQLRTGVNTRLAVELLLLRWAMMARTVELGDVIAALGKGGGQGDRRSGGQNNPAPQLHDSSPPVRPSAGPPEKGPLTLDRLRSLWPRIVEDARREKPMLGALLPAVEPAALDGTTVVARVRDPVHAEGLERQRESLAQLIARYVTEPVRIRVEAVGSGEGKGNEDRPGERTAARPARLTEQGVRAERLDALRARDPGLDAAVEALDLELLE